MPSRLWYVGAAVLPIIGIAVAVWLVLSGLAGLQTALVRVVVPGNSVITLSEPGTYTIFHEAESIVDGRIYAAKDVAGLRVLLSSEATGSEIPLATPTSNTEYSFGGHHGIAVLTFDISEPGRYRIRGGYPNGQSGSETVLAIGQGVVGQLMRTIFGCIAVMFLGIGGGLLLAAVTFFRRRRAKRAGRLAVLQPAA